MTHRGRNTEEKNHSPLLISFTLFLTTKCKYIRRFLAYGHCFCVYRHCCSDCSLLPQIREDPWVPPARPSLLSDSKSSLSFLQPAFFPSLFCKSRSNSCEQTCYNIFVHLMRRRCPHRCCRVFMDLKCRSRSGQSYGNSWFIARRGQRTK